MDRNNILDLIVNTYGADPQIEMTIEECSELIKALLKHRRALRHTEAWNYERIKQNIIEEIADVQIMLLQLEKIYQCANEVERQVDFKLNRQLERIKNYKNNQN